MTDSANPYPHAKGSFASETLEAGQERFYNAHRFFMELKVALFNNGLLMKVEPAPSHVAPVIASPAIDTPEQTMLPPGYFITFAKKGKAWGWNPILPKRAQAALSEALDAIYYHDKGELAMPCRVNGRVWISDEAVQALCKMPLLNPAPGEMDETSLAALPTKEAERKTTRFRAGQAMVQELVADLKGIVVDRSR